MFNQLGHGSPHLENTPKLVQGLKEKKIKKAAAGIYQSLVLTGRYKFLVLPFQDSNELFAFGRNLYINGKRKNDFKIERITLEKEEIIDVQCGISSLYVLTSNNESSVKFRKRKALFLGRQFRRTGTCFCDFSKSNSSGLKTSLVVFQNGSNH